MNYKKRVAKIVSEVIDYFFSIGVENLHIDINEEKQQYKVIFNCLVKDFSTKQLEFLTRSLSYKKSIEVEEMYWELAGENDDSQALSLVGMMIDDFTLNIYDNNLELILYRNKIY